MKRSRAYVGNLAKWEAEYRVRYGISQKQFYELISKRFEEAENILINKQKQKRGKDVSLFKC